MLPSGTMHISTGICTVGRGMRFLKLVGHQAGVLSTGFLDLEFVSFPDPADPDYPPEYAIE